MTLYIKIRPKTFDEVQGQVFTVNNLRMQSIRDKFFQVLFWPGSTGPGKQHLPGSWPRQQTVKTKIRMEILAVSVMDADLYLVDLYTFWKSTMPVTPELIM